MVLLKVLILFFISKFIAINGLDDNELQELCDKKMPGTGLGDYRSVCLLKDTKSLFCQGFWTTDTTLEDVITCLNDHSTSEQKHYREMHLLGTDLTGLKANVFKNLTFDSLVLESNYRIKLIDTNAFSATNAKTKSIRLTGLTGLDQISHSFFEILSKFVNLQNLQIDNINIGEIPSNAFRNINGHQNSLKSIEIKGHGSGQFKSIGTRAFYYLNSLEHLRLDTPYLHHISQRAFEFEKKSTHHLQVYFETSENIQPTSFEIDSLISIKRPTTIFVNAYKGYFAYLDEKIFLPFMLAEPQNTLVFEIPIDCNDCRNAWLSAYSSILKYRVTCYDSKIDVKQATFFHCNKLQ